MPYYCTISTSSISILMISEWRVCVRSKEDEEKKIIIRTAECLNEQFSKTRLGAAKCTLGAASARSVCATAETILHGVSCIL